jgi:hypothetical protein
MSGVFAAYAAAREGLDVALVIGDNPLGGMSANGISRADVNTTKFLGGLTKEFYARIGRHYGQDVCFCFEPHVALSVAERFVEDGEIPVFTGSLLRVHKSRNKITALVLRDGSAVTGKFFVDSSYEGDLMAAARVSYATGRESSSQYGESLAGFDANEVLWPFQAYHEDGRRLWGISAKPDLAPGSADTRLPAYNYRLCVTNDPANRLAYPVPPNYDADRYLLKLETIHKHSVYTRAGASLPNRKFDVDGGGLMDSDYIGASWGYPDGDAARRRAIINAHYEYHTGLLYFLANDPRVPAAYRESFADYGLSADEYRTNGGWPLQLYIREGRRMIGNYVVQQSDAANGTVQDDPIGVALSNIDCHATIRYPSASGDTILEGTMSLAPAAVEVRPYNIPYRSITPIEAEADNLLVTVCVSASHIGYCTIRLEHQYMIMGEAAGVAIALASEAGTNVQNVPVAELVTRLKKYGAVLSTS